MEENRIEFIEQLIKEWNDLRYDMTKRHKVVFEDFESTYLKTYQLLSEHFADLSLDKRYIALIVSASLFANSQNPESDFTCAAIFSLTERMLACCALVSSEEPVVGTNVYVFEARKEVYINFANVRESINILTKLFRENYWDNL